MRDPMLPLSFRVAAKRRELADTWTLELEPDAGAHDRLGAFAPGQFAMLYAFGSGEVPISVSGGVGGEGPLVHTVRAVGAATRAICAAEPGDSVGVRGPFGNTWPIEEAEGGDVVVVAGGIGLAPLRPAIERLAASRERFGAVTLLYGARSPDEMLFTEELDSWRSAGIAVETIVDSAPAGWSGRVGLVTKLIDEAELSGGHTTALICGPEVMMRFVGAELVQRGVERSRIHISMERNMKCAIGHCGHCQLGPAFICKDGPVFTLAAIEPLMAVREL
ncbi:MAG TPA: FAD/NAD(P)-binding protein [Solirubrobacterales bacterium]|nr:FAD/NAD(P)-binding protein [Solirubrobacterales bacterium]